MILIIRNNRKIETNTYSRAWFQSMLGEESPNPIICNSPPPPPPADSWSSCSTMEAAVEAAAESIVDLDFMSTISVDHPKLAMAFNVVDIDDDAGEVPLSNLFLDDVSHQLPLPSWNSSAMAAAGILISLSLFLY